MTDNFGTEPHDRESGHDEVLTPENHAHEPPSDYEFADIDEHSATSAEESGEEHASMETKMPPRSPVLPVMAAVGGVLLLGVVAWWQFGSSPSTPPEPMVSSPTPSLAMAPPAAPVAAPVIPAQPIAPRTDTAPAPMDMPPEVKTPDIIIAPAPVVAAPVVSAPAPAMPVAVVPVPVAPVAPMVVPAAPVVTSDVDQRIETLNAHVESLQRSLDQLTNMMAASAGSAPGSVPADVQERLDRLEKELGTARSQVATVSETHKARAHKATHKAAVKTARRAAPQWVLRSASPGRAWVATGTDSLDLKELQVGDTLPGIGRVLDIRQQETGWVVLGTKGSLQ